MRTGYRPTRCCRGAVAALALVAIQSPLQLAAQSDPLSVPRFPIQSSSIALRSDVRPHEYLGVIGRAAAWLGSETGEAELWVHPIKLASDFELSFTIPDYMQPIRGADVARTVEVRPELTTITYSHATFTVREHILAPLDEPGLLLLLDVQTFRPLEITVSFQTVFQYAWPGAFGGQYAFWSGDDHAFILSESLRRRTGIIGSPWATTASSHPAHALPDAPSRFVIPVDTARAKHEYIPIAVTAATAPRDSVLAEYRSLLAHAERLYREKRGYVETMLAQTTSIDTPDDRLDLAFAWSKVNLDEALTCNPDLGCGLVAGWGPSGTGARPGFGWFFGGDAAINSFAMSATRLWEPVARGLRFLARYQREDGKIPHEISQAAGQIPWFTEFPYAYYHADTTPYWIVALWRYWRASGDSALVGDLWPAVERAYGWCRTRDTDGDGIIENGPGNLGAIEVGALGEGIHEDIYLAAVWIEALQAMQELALARGNERLASEAGLLHTRAMRTLNEAYWRESEGHHAFGILESGKTNDNLTVWPATAAAFHLLDQDRADRTLTKLATDSITSDWGARILSTGSPLYDPTHYNNGAVWPFVTGFVIWGQYSYRRPWSGYGLIDALGQITFDWARGRHPELLSGRYYRPLDTAVPQQFFATSMLVSSIMMGLVGWDPDAPHGHVGLAPQIPPQWRHVTVRNLEVGPTTLEVEIAQDTGRFDVRVRRDGPPLDLTITVPIPPGARQIVSDPGAVEQRVSAGGREITMQRSKSLDAATTEMSWRWTGGLSVVPPVAHLTPGQRSTGLRILDFRADGSRDDAAWLLVAEGESGTTYRLDLIGESLASVEGARIVDVEAPRTTIQIAMPDGRGRSTTTIHLFAAQ